MTFQSQDEMDTAFLIHDLANEVTKAESRLEDQLKWLEGKTKEVRRHLEVGQAHNSLGELQSLAAGFDVAVGRLELAADLFKQAWRVLGVLTQPDESDTPAEALIRRMTLSKIESSHRLTAIVGKS